MPKLATSDIKVDTRIREEMGNIAELAESIQKYGLLHPLVLDADKHLVAGGRRLEAIKSLGWLEVEVRYLGELGGRERRLIEVEENIRRKDLTEYERSQRLVELMEAVKEVAEEEKAAPMIDEFLTEPAQEQELEEEFRLRGERKQGLPLGQTVTPDSNDLSTRGVDNTNYQKGRPAVPGSLRNVSQITGIPEQTFREAKQHVNTVKEIPALEDQPKKAVVQVGRELKKINDPQEREEYKEALTEHPEIIQTTTKPFEVTDIHQKLQNKHMQQMEDIDAKYDRLEKLRKGIRSILDLSVPDEVELQRFYLTMVDNKTRIALENELGRLERAEFIISGLSKKLRAQLNGKLEAIRK